MKINLTDNYTIASIFSSIIKSSKQLTNEKEEEKASVAVYGRGLAES